MKTRATFAVYLFTLSLLVIAFVYAGTARTAFSAETKIVVVDIKKIMKESKAATSVRNQVKSKQKSFQAELDSKEKSLQSEDKALAKERSTLSKEAFETKYRAFRTKAAKAQQQVQTKRVKLDKGFAKALGQIQNKVESIVASIASSKGADIAIARSHLIYAKSEQDITAEVLSKLNADMPSVSMSF